jgi:hypothetical protein
MLGQQCLLCIAVVSDRTNLLLAPGWPAEATGEAAGEDRTA